MDEQSLKEKVGRRLTLGSVLPQSPASSAPQSVVVPPAILFQSWSVPPVGAVNPGVGPLTGAALGVTCDAVIGAAPHCTLTYIHIMAVTQWDRIEAILLLKFDLCSVLYVRIEFVCLHLLQCPIVQHQL